METNNCFVHLFLNGNTRERLGELEIAVETLAKHSSAARVSTSFIVLKKLTRVTIILNVNTVNVFYLVHIIHII